MTRHLSLHFLLLVISAMAILIHGYSFSGGDQTIYVPAVLQKINPKLYQHDSITKAPEKDLSVFFTIMASIVRTTSTDIEWVYILLYFVVHYWFIFSAYSLTYTITRNHQTALIATSIIALPKYVGGTTITTVDFSWIPRFLALPFSLNSINASLQTRPSVAVLLLSIAFVIHPFTGISTGLFLVGIFVLIKIPVRQAISASLFSLPLLAWIITIHTQLPAYHNPLLIDSSWWQILLSRIPYNFLQTWKLSGWGSIGITLVLLLLNLRTKPSSELNKKIIHSGIGIALMVTIVHLLTVEILKLSVFTQLQLLRIWLWPTILSLIVTSDLIVKLLRKKSPINTAVAVVLLASLYTNFGHVRTTAAIEWPHSNKNDWIAVQEWIKKNTPTDAIILTPPHRNGFRIYSQRSIVGEIKDGSSSLYSWELASLWQQRLSDVHPLGNKTTIEIKKLAQKYHADYFVAFTDDPIYRNLPELFRTKTLVVYKL